ncbi:MAG TPA: hypothetical protein VK335_10105 [Bryobacteraceae bacterium]|nr:hypothetical protein [Bryobacteraceae bacterium]
MAKQRRSVDSALVSTGRFQSTLPTRAATTCGRYASPPYRSFNPRFTPAAQSNFNSANQLMIQSSTYDGSGNQQVVGAYSFKYDGENRQTSVKIGSSTAGTYSYDADGRRVTKVSGGATRVYVYDAQGQLAAEYYSGNPQDTLCQPCSLTADHLGSTREETDGASGQAVACHDYLPFGEEIPGGMGGRTAACFTAADALTERFTGKERDTETASSAMQGLDFFGARYMSSAQGRFTSPDSIQSPRNDWSIRNSGTCMCTCGIIHSAMWIRTAKPAQRCT